MTEKHYSPDDEDEENIPLDELELDGDPLRGEAVGKEWAEMRRDSDFVDAVIANDLLKVEALLADGAAVSATRDGLTPLHIAAHYGFQDVADVLLGEGADINAATDKRYTPLCYPALRGDNVMVRFLLANGADPHSCTDLPLRWASLRGHREVVDTLIAAGADVNAYDSDPLYLAAKNGHEDVVALLLVKGANPNPDCDPDWNPLVAAARNGHRQIVDILVSSGTSVDKVGGTALRVATANTHKDVARQLMALGADVNAAGEDGQTVLHLLAAMGNIPLMRMAITKGAVLDVKNVKGLTPLHEAMIFGNATAAEFLASMGADVNARDAKGRTPLHWLADHGDVDLAELLIELGAVVNARDGLARSPLHWQAVHGSVDLVDLFVRRGADVSMVDSDGLTAYQLALQYGQYGVANQIRQTVSSVPTSSLQEARCSAPACRAAALPLTHPPRCAEHLADLAQWAAKLYEIASPTDDKSESEPDAEPRRSLLPALAREVIRQSFARDAVFAEFYWHHRKGVDPRATGQPIPSDVAHFLIAAAATGVKADAAYDAVKRCLADLPRIHSDIAPAFERVVAMATYERLRTDKYGGTGRPAESIPARVVMRIEEAWVLLLGSVEDIRKLGPKTNARTTVDRIAHPQS